VGLGANEPVREREFDRYAQDADRRLTALERFREKHEDDHEESDGERRETWRWTWQQVAAWVATAAVLASAWLSFLTAR